MREGILSIIVPAYNESDNISNTAAVISSLMEEHRIEYRLIFVNDGSTDDTWEKILNAHKENSHIFGVCFSRNFGKESAILAGLAKSDGACSVVIDCDLQHPPEKIIEMYRLWQQGYDVIEAVKKSRGKENIFYKFLSHIFYSLMSKIVKTDMKNTTDFRLIDRKVVDILLNMKEQRSFFRALSSWVGFEKVSIEFEVKEREFGKTKWSKKSLVKYALSSISSFTAFPLYIMTAVGVLFSLVALVVAAIALYQKIIGIAAEGFTTVIILLVFIGGVTMMGIGMNGYYISRIYEEIKGRPKYIIKDETEDNTLL